MSTLTGFRKRNRRIVEFDPSRIETAVRRAAADRTGHSIPEELPAEIAGAVCTRLTETIPEDSKGRRIPNMSQVQECTEECLNDMGWKSIAISYGQYREDRDKARKRLKVRRNKGKQTDVTDMSLLLVDHAGGDTSPWDREEIESMLSDEYGLDEDVTGPIAKSIENRLIRSEILTIEDSLLTEFIRLELEERGIKADRASSSYSISTDFLESLIFNKSNENSNLASNNPEAVNLGISEYILKQWALNNVFSPRVRRAHETGAIHLHDLGFATRLYAFSKNTLVKTAFRGGSWETRTLKDLWEAVPGPVRALASGQLFKDVPVKTGLLTMDRDEPVRITRLVLSPETLPMVSFTLSDGSTVSVTEDHGCVVIRDGRCLIVRADEVSTTDSFVQVTSDE